MKRRYQGWVVWCLALAILFAQSGWPGFIVYAQETQAETEAKIAQLEKLFDALEAASKNIPRDTFDLEAALELTDLTPEGILAWVRDNTYLVPYKGALRGAQGVLMDRVGNSLDRALLLQGLMQLLGYDTQLARAQLSEAQAQDVLARTKPIPAEGALPQTADTNINAELQKYASEFGLDQSQLTQALEQANQQRETLQAEMKTRVASQTAFLLNTLGSPTGDVAAEQAKQVAALQDHWWVQYQEGGVWVDLDPSLPDALPNQKVVPASETLVANKLEDLPQDLLHTMQIKVVLECALDSGLQETTLVESPVLIPANLLGRRIAISHVPMNMPQNLEATDATTIKDLVLKQDRWFPVLSVGSESTFDRDYTSACEIGTASPPWLGTAITGGLEDALDVFGDMDGTDTATTANERVTAQWIDYTLHVPGEADQTVRKQIFDLLGPAARASGGTFTPSNEQQLAWRFALLGETEILPLAGGLSAQYVETLTAQSLVNSRDALIDMARHVSDQAKVREAANQIKPQSTQLHVLALIRQEQRVAGVYLAQPNVLSYHKQQTLNSGGEVVNFEGFDIVVNKVLVDSRKENAFSLQLEQGVIDTNTEAILVTLGCQATASIVCAKSGNPSEFFETMTQQGISWHTVRTEGDLATLTLSSDVQTRIKKEVADGYVVVVPEKPVKVSDKDTVAWWRVDAASGESLGIDERGWGPEFAEYAFVVAAVALSTAACYKSNGNDPRCFLGALFGGIALLPMAAGLGALAAFIALFSAFMFAAPSFSPYN